MKSSLPHGIVFEKKGLFFSKLKGVIPVEAFSKPADEKAGMIRAYVLDEQCL